MKTLRFRTSHETHTGMRRQENEDAVAIHPGGTLWAVADGMGGHLHGRFASDAVVHNLSDVDLRDHIENDSAAIVSALNEANKTILKRAETEGATIGTTVAAFHASGSKGACLWVGDSRIYRLREGELEQLTSDHTQVRHLLETQQITPDEAKNHPMGHVLTRAVGVDRSLRVEQRIVDLLPEDLILICSDGLTACASPDDIRTILLETGATRACKRLVNLCLERGAPDNVSIVIVVCDEVTAVDFETTAA